MDIDDTTYNREIYIYIRQTTRAALKTYSERHIQAGWEISHFSGLLDGTGDELWLGKNGLKLALSLKSDDYIEIVFWYDIGVEKYW